MRVITKKDKRGLLVAFRRFLKAMSGERISQQAGEPLLESALDAGISFDALLNRENWGRAKEIMPELTAADYVEMLRDNRIEVRDLADEPNWHEVDNGFAVIAEAAHDFFMEICGRGGKWNIPSALINLAKVIRDHSLQAILSEELIEKLTKEDAEMNYFTFIQAIAHDFNAIEIDDEPTEQQQKRREEMDALVKAAIEGAQEPGSEEEAAPEGGPEEEVIDEPYPENEGPEGDGISDMARMFDTNFIIPDPNKIKRDAIREVLDNYTPEELLSIVDTINNGRRETVNTLIDILVDGKFDPTLESAKARDIHKAINIDLMPSFISCVNTQEGIHVDESQAEKFDILHDSWDLRPVAARKLYKLKLLIKEAETKDPDVIEALCDIERLYAAKEEE